VKKNKFPMNIEVSPVIARVSLTLIGYEAIGE
jgi:hypothetical protein